MNKVKKIWLVVIFILSLGIGVWLYIIKKRNNTLVTPAKANIKDLKVSLAKAKNNAKVIQKQTSILGSYATLASTSFSNSLINNYAANGYENPSFLPMTEASSTKFSLANLDANTNAMRALVTKYDAEVSRQSILWKVPRWMIYTIMLNENTQGIADLVSGSTAKYTSDVLGGKSIEYAKQYGLGQWKPYSATDTLRIALKKGILQTEHAIALQNLANGDRMDKVLSTTQLGDIIITGEELKKPEFNIAMIASNLAILMDNYSMELYKIVASYNQGYYFVGNKGLNKYKTFQTFYANCPTDPQNYLLNTLGKYGSAMIAVYYLGIKD